MNSALSAIAPLTMVAAVAANTNWKNQNAYLVSSMSVNAKLSCPMNASPLPLMSSPSPPKANAKPNNQYTAAPETKVKINFSNLLYN